MSILIVMECHGPEKYYVASIVDKVDFWKEIGASDVVLDWVQNGIRLP